MEKIRKNQAEKVGKNALPDNKNSINNELSTAFYDRIKNHRKLFFFLRLFQLGICYYMRGITGCDYKREKFIFCIFRYRLD
jgi:hypothetical protein